MIVQVTDVTNDLDDLALALYPHVFGGQRVSLITRLRPRMIGRTHPKRRLARMKRFCGCLLTIVPASPGLSMLRRGQGLNASWPGGQPLPNAAAMAASLRGA